MRHVRLLAPLLPAEASYLTVDLACHENGESRALTSKLTPSAKRVTLISPGCATVDGRRGRVRRGQQRVRSAVLLGPCSGCLLSPRPLDDDMAIAAIRAAEPVETAPPPPCRDPAGS